METIIAEIWREFTNKMLEIIMEGGTLAKVEAAALREVKACAAQVVSAYAKQVDEAIVADKAARRKSGHVVERRGDERRIQTELGEICYPRTYFQKASGGYEYLTDMVLGVDKRQRVSEGLSLSLVRAAKDMSYAKASTHLTGGAISRQTVMEKVRGSYAEGAPPEPRRQVAELHIDADEAHITLHGGRKSEVPLISIYEGIEAQGKRRACKNVFHISAYGKSPDDLWEQALTEALKRYDLTHTRIYLHGDGARWIRKGLEWFAGATFVLDKYHKNKAIKGMTAGLFLPERKSFDAALRAALADEDTALFDRLTMRLYDALPERTATILENARYLKAHIAGISICATDPDANNGGCTEPHVSHVLSARLSARPMAWSPQTLSQLAPMLAGGNVRKIPTPAPSMPPPLQNTVARAKRAFCTRNLGLPAPEAIGRLALSGKVTGTSKILKLLA